MTGPSDPDDSPFSTPELESVLQQRPGSARRRRRPGVLVAVVATTALVAIGLVGALFVAAGGDDNPSGANGAPAIEDPMEELERTCLSAFEELQSLAGRPALIVALVRRTIRQLALEGENVDEILSRWDAAAAALASALAAAQRADVAGYEESLERARSEAEIGNSLAQSVELDSCVFFMEQSVEEFARATQS